MLNLIVRLYDSNKRQVKQTQFSKVKYFHLFLKSKNGSLKRLTSEIEEVPSQFRLASERRYYVESACDYFVDFLNQELERKKAVRDARAKARSEKERQRLEAEAIEKSRKITVQTRDFPEPEIVNYDFPDKPKVNRISGEVVQYVYDLVTKKVSGFDIPWDKKRVKGFVRGLAEYFAGKNLAIPTDKKFIDTLVVVNLGYTGGQGFDGIIESSREEIGFLESLHEREITKNYFTDAEVNFQTKEIYRHNYIKEIVEYTTKSGGVLKYREQTILLQMELKYHEIIRVDQIDVMNDAAGFEGPVSRVRADIKFLFQYAIDRGIFNYTDKYVYSVRLITPMLAKGVKLGERVDSKGEIANGYGYSCPRSPLTDHLAIDKIIDSLFASFKTDMLTYLARSNMASFAFEGLTIERLLNP